MRCHSFAEFDQFVSALTIPRYEEQGKLTALGLYVSKCSAFYNALRGLMRPATSIRSLW